MSISQPTKAAIRRCIIGNVPHLNDRGIENFAIHAFRVYEDICKPYFTATLLIEDQMNNTDPYLYPAVNVEISFESLPNNKKYTETFRIYSIESKPKGDDLYGGMLITINLIGEEYYNDVQNTVMQSFDNKTAVSAAVEIHNTFISENGPISATQSTGLIATDKLPHMVQNLKPIKAIHDLLDKAISGTWTTHAFTYFRNKQGYVIAPLQELLTTSPILGNFVHNPASGSDLNKILAGYNEIIHLRPMAPPSQETAAGIRSVELDSLMKTSSFFDVKTGNLFNTSSTQGLQKLVGTLAKIKSTKGLSAIGKSLLKDTVKTKFGARMMFAVLNEDRQPRAIDKHGPAGHNSQEEAFVSALNHQKKYWISVPLQSGINITIGNRIKVVYPVNTKRTEKTLFVVRLVHEIQYKTPGSKNYEPVQGTTDMYCIEW